MPRNAEPSALESYEVAGRPFLKNNEIYIEKDESEKESGTRGDCDGRIKLPGGRE